MATRDLLYILDRLLHVTWNRNLASPSITHPYNLYICMYVCVYNCVRVYKWNANDELMMWVVKR